MFRDCKFPITSYGIIATRNTGPKPDLTQASKPDATHLIATGPRDGIEFLLICRRDSLSYIEFVRGKYSTTDRTYLYALLKNMTVEEHGKIRSHSFDQLWRSVWGGAADTHKTDYETSQRKFASLQPIGELLDAHATTWTEPEWGFPKGRRNANESDISGAIREFQEETNLAANQFQILQNVAPLVESFLGSNQIKYCHKYYLAVCDASCNVAVSHENPHMSREIGTIGWFSQEVALAKLRPDAKEKRSILANVGRIMRTYWPV
jgi:8-oxo-dGTP pyrophosphatase MutT (NUDIX family)